MPHPRAPDDGGHGLIITGSGADAELTSSPDRVGPVTTCDRACCGPERGAERTVKVAHLIPTLHADGPEIGLVDLAGVARQADIDMIVVALSVSSDAAEVNALRRAGVPVAELDLFPWDPRAVPRTCVIRVSHSFNSSSGAASALSHCLLVPAEWPGAPTHFSARSEVALW